MKHVTSRGGRTKSALWTILGILAELMLTAAAICALYIAWQMWWTGVQSEHNQIETRQSVSWSDPGKSGNVTVAKHSRVTRLYSRKAPRKANSSPKSTYRDSAANGSATWWKART